LLEDILRECDGEEKRPFLSRLKAGLLRSKPIRERIILCIYRLRVQKGKLELLILKIRKRDRELLGRCVDAQVTRDGGRATMYAEACHEVRTIFKIVFHCKLALEQVILRLETVEIFTDLAASIIIPVSLVREVKGKLSGILPLMADHLGDIASELEGMIQAAGRVESTPVGVSSITEEAKVILEEARVMVEAQVKEVFPDLESAAYSPNREPEPT
jgi:division protein CdvB (Snf7/Vps24/ESCRT-III family)